MSVRAFAPARISLTPRVAPRTAVAAHARAGPWFPGSEAPAHLDGTLPADYGFDPLKLGETNMNRLRESELIHCRWAMAAAAGCMFVELVGQGNWFDAPLWAVNGGMPTYFGVPVPFDIRAIVLVELVLMAGAEILRNEESDPAKRQYPGGAFDPMGFSKEDNKLREMKVKELNNGRLAMMAFLGFVCQHEATGKGPLANLFDHISNPAVNNYATNGVSLPQFAFPFLY